MNFEEKLELFLSKYFVKDFLSRFVPAILLYVILVQFQIFKLPADLVFQLFFILPLLWCFGYAIETLNKNLPLLKGIYMSKSETTPLRALTINHFMANLGISVIWFWFILVLIYFFTRLKLDLFSLSALPSLFITLAIGALLVWVALKQKKVQPVSVD